MIALRTRAIEVSASTTGPDGTGLTTAFVVDVTDRKRAEEALPRSEARFKRLIDAAPEAVCILTQDRIVYANPTCAELLGAASPKELRGSDPRRFIHPTDIGKFEQRSRALLTEGKRQAPCEYRFLRSSSQPLVMEVSSIAVEHEGRPAILSFGRDVTERKQLESELMQADRLGVLGMLAGGMAHAINNPLTYVLLNLDDVVRRLPDVPAGSGSLTEALARLREAHQGAERIASVVRQMRAFSRPEERAPGPVDIRRVLEAVVAMVGNEIRHRGRLVTEFADVPLVQASSARLEHVFLNLLVHVAQALPEGDPEGEIRLRLRPGEPGEVVVEVSDSGPGIEPAVLDRIFDPFSTASDPAAGIGLGLSLCSSIVTSFGGSMQAKSQLGRGTTFRVCLPAEASHHESPRRPVVGPQPPPIPSSRRVRVLVVDDDSAVANALRLMLEDDHDVTSVASGREALRMLVRSDEYDIVLCDLMMPEVSGMDLFEALQLNCPGRERHLVFMTGGAFTPEAARFLKQVPNARIEKPFDMDSVRTLLQFAAQRDG